MQHAPFENLQNTIDEHKLSTSLTQQLSYFSALVEASFHSTDSLASLFDVVEGNGLGVREMYDGASDLDVGDKVDEGRAPVQQEHVDVHSDGVYLNTASTDSFIGVSLSPPAHQSTFPDTRPFTRFKRVQPLPETYPAHASPTFNTRRDHGSSIKGLPDLSTTVPPTGCRSLSVENATPRRGTRSKSLNTRSRTPPETSQEVDFLPMLPPSGREIKGLRRTSLTKFSNLKTGKSDEPVHDFDVVIVERESSGESSTYAESSNEEADSSKLSEQTIAGQAFKIVQEGKIEAIAQEQKRLDWEAYGQQQRENGPIRFRPAWTKDLLLRECKRQIQDKLCSRA